MASLRKFFNDKEDGVFRPNSLYSNTGICRVWPHPASAVQVGSLFKVVSKRLLLVGTKIIKLAFNFLAIQARFM